MPSVEKAKTSHQIAVELAAQFPHKPEFAHFSEWENRLKPKLHNYLGWLNATFFGEQSEVKFAPEATARILDIMGRNHLMSHVLTTPEFEEVINDEKKLRGEDENITVGISRCIDGRLPNKDNRLFKVHESKAGLLETETVINPTTFQEKKVLTSGRMIEAIKGEANKGPLLQILMAHTHQAVAPCDCGAMDAIKSKYPPNTDLVLENIKLHKDAAEAIDTLYNEEVVFNKRPERIQARTAITAVYETNTQGIVLGYGEEGVDTYSTTSLALEIASMKNNFVGALIGKKLDITKAISNEKKVCEVTRALLDQSSLFFNRTSEYIKRNPTLKDLNPAQIQALIFYLGRTTAIQLLTQSFDESVDNPFRKHNEEFQSLSADDVAVGQILPGQVFVSNPHPSQAVDHILTQYKLMNHYVPERKKPDILFISNAQSSGLQEGRRDSSKGLTIEMLRKIYINSEIRRLILSQELLPIPVIIDEKTRDVKHIFNPVGTI